MFFQEGSSRSSMQTTTRSPPRNSPTQIHPFPLYGRPLRCSASCTDSSLLAALITQAGCTTSPHSPPPTHTHSQTHTHTPTPTPTHAHTQTEQPRPHPLALCRRPLCRAARPAPCTPILYARLIKQVRHVVLQQHLCCQRHQVLTEGYGGAWCQQRAYLLDRSPHYTGECAGHP